MKSTERAVKNKMQDLVGLSREQLTNILSEMGEKPFRAKQLWQWIYNKGERDFSKMSSLSKATQEKLSGQFIVSRPQVIVEKNSTDGTRKWLFQFDDGKQVETVYIPEEDRGAVCLSTQVGCLMGCKFCHTGTQKMQRNLTAGEIVGQFMAARDSYGEWPTPANETRFLSNVVVMGMGEPLMNYDNMVQAMRILMDGEGIALSKRRITVSTCGIADKIPSLATDLGVKLAISLHAPNNAIRNQIMPINKKYPLEVLIKACKEYQARLPHRQYITMEYVLLKGVNDSIENAKELIELVKGLEVKFNLIPFNPWIGCPFEPSSNNQIHRFAKVLEDAYLAAPIRISRGQDIMAACGQLKSAMQNKNI